MFIDKPSLKITITPKLRNFLKEERESHGITTITLSKAINRPQSWITQIENGRIQTIRNINFINIFEKILNVSAEEAEKYLIDNQDKFISGLPDSIKKKYNIEDTINDEPVIYLPKDANEDTEHLKDTFKQYTNHITDNFIGFFDRMQNKKIAVEIINSFVVNMHIDLGFIISLCALPLYKIENLNGDEKQKLFYEISDVIEKHGSDKK